MLRMKLSLGILAGFAAISSAMYFGGRHEERRYERHHHEAAANVTAVFCAGSATPLVFDVVRLSHIDRDDGPIVSIPNPPDPATVGTASIVNNMINFLPAAGAASPVIFEYQLDWQEDSHHPKTITPETQTAQVTVYIRSSDSSPPTAADFPNENVGAGDTLYIDVLAAASITGPGKEKLTINAPSAPTAGGTATVSGHSIKYVAPASAVTDTFTYTLSDECGNSSNTATVTVNVTAPGTGAVAGNKQRAENVSGVFCDGSTTPLVFDVVRSSDIDRDDSPIVSIPNPPDPTTVGTASIVNNTINFLPVAGAASPVIFEYRLDWTEDSHHGSTSTNMSQTAQVTVYIRSSSAPPVAADFPNETVGSGGTLLIDVLAAATTSGPGKEKLTINPPATPTAAGGTVSVVNHSIEYVAPTPAVTDSFTYTLSDECGNVSNIATVTVNANLANSAAAPAASAAPQPPAQVLLVNNSSYEIAVKVGGIFVDELQPNGSTVVPANVPSGATDKAGVVAFLPRPGEPRKTTATLSLDPNVQYTITYSDDNVNPPTITQSP